ncbi:MULTISPECIES: hypothetical protein [unclassified Streptomyces]|uniref:AraC-like ligand-binding domain-containing protein n=1 Tax=Streptomyces sp. SID8377 TaxID=2690357 RepID=UPI001EEF8173|nr:MULTISPECIES: hypothetical protein [unclassified Streptomyces]
MPTRADRSPKRPCTGPAAGSVPDVRSASPDRPPSAAGDPTLRPYAVGPVEVAGIDWNVTGLRRASAPLKEDMFPHVLVALQESGVPRFSQGGNQGEIRAGDLTVIENARPYEIFFRSPVRTVVVRVPTHILGPRSSLLGQVAAVRLGSERPLVGAAVAFFARRPAVRPLSARPRPPCSRSPAST